MGRLQVRPNQNSQSHLKGQTQSGRLRLQAPTVCLGMGNINQLMNIVSQAYRNYTKEMLTLWWLIRNWDEKRVGEWLRSINCAQYEQLFEVSNSPSNVLLSHKLEPCHVLFCPTSALLSACRSTFLQFLFSFPRTTFCTSISKTTGSRSRFVRVQAWRETRRKPARKHYLTATSQFQSYYGR
jgi:hypothetical protein